MTRTGYIYEYVSAEEVMLPYSYTVEVVCVFRPPRRSHMDESLSRRQRHADVVLAE